jgi:signal transduction histidine kinase
MLSRAEGSKQHSTRVADDLLSTSIIHDLRNPLAAICAGAEMLADLHLTPDHAQRLGHNIRAAAGRMRRLLADLAGVSQGKTGAEEDCYLREILISVSDELAAAAARQDVEIFLDVPAGLEMTMARARIERVFINLIANALEAMPGGGQIRVTATNAGECAVIAVEDSGPGIAPEISDRLFDPFVTAGKKEGLGLGLALSRQAIRQHGGDLWLEPAEGARFVIRLPLKAELK